MKSGVALVASPGGHCDQMFEVAERFGSRESRFWITARTPQTEALLRHEDVEWVPPVWSRQAGRAAASFGKAVHILRRRQPQRLASTGAALSVPFMLTARAMGMEVTYLESATRLAGPSVSGRIVEKVPGVRLYRQAPEWERPRPRWGYRFSIFDAYANEDVPSRTITTVLVTVGSERFSFERSIEMVLTWARGRDVKIAWQTGHTPVKHELPGRVDQWWPGDKLAQAARESDLVITHAGVGSILSVLRAGSCPVVIPRLSSQDEHIDDHQGQLAASLATRGLVSVARSAVEMEEAVDLASCRRIVKKDVRSTFD